ncbi:MAG: hypothetical protein IJ266_03415 [Elusimicrobiaceae bacterium]|nr:hypothetical protein [Elusimicrobiaceae bacterium]
MKKTILTACCIVVASLTYAQNLGVGEHTRQNTKDPNVLGALIEKAAVAWQNRQPLPWAKSVEHQRHASEPIGLVGVNTLKHISSPQHPKVPQGVSSTYYARLHNLQLSLAKNPVLRNYRIMAPRPADVMDLSDIELFYLKSFFEAPVKVGKQDRRYKPISVEELEHYLVKIELRAPRTNDSMFLIVNCYTRDIYLAHGNPNLPGIPLEKSPQKNHMH